MLRFAMRAGRVWVSVPATVRLLALAAAVAILLTLSVGSVLAGEPPYEPYPFRWK
jgi:hypothetical protein